MPSTEVRRNHRLWVPGAIFLAFAIAIAYQLIDIQVLHHDRYSADAADELIHTDEIYARRGSILDRNGNPLALSVSTWDLYINSRAWPTEDIAQTAASELTQFIGTPASELVNDVLTSESLDVIVARDISYEHGLQIMDEGIDGVILLPNSRRLHPEGDIGASLIGFIGADNTGLVGLENYYDDMLRGEPGRVLYERDTVGDPIPYGMRLREAPTPGADITLTIDRYLQELAETTLAKSIEKHKAKGGTIIIMDPDSGELLAVASAPTFTFSALETLTFESEEEKDLLTNGAVSDLYEPGSVMKVVTAASAVDAGKVTENTSYLDTGSVTIGDAELFNYQHAVYGSQTMTQVLENSINTGSVYMAQLLGDEQFHEYLTRFGFGAPTGIDFPGEATGLYRRPGDEGWTAVDLATQSFGQAISVTPVQMVSAVAAAINGGHLPTPHFVKEMTQNGVNEPAEFADRGDPITPASSDMLRRMTDAVIGPPNPMNPAFEHPATSYLYTTGGKSGTSSVPVPNGYDETVTASFVSYAPVDNPRVLVYVKLDENQDLEVGSQATGPIARDLIDATLRYLDVPPDMAPVDGAVAP